MAAGKGENMVMLRSRDGIDFVVPELEARKSMIIEGKIRYDSANYFIPSDIHYCENHASRDDPDWDAQFITGADHETLYDLILASNYLQIRGLLDLVCYTIASKIKEKSPSEICNIFNIKSVFSPELDEETRVQRSQHSCSSRRSPVGVSVLPNEKPCLNELELEEAALRALHVVRCQEFTRYGPKLNGFVCYRFNNYNLALFDHDKESNFCRGPPLHEIPSPMLHSVVQSCVNVISLKVRESNVGFPINIFGTVVARDQVDYRCVYLFRRESDDPQLISSRDDMLSLIDPCRALIPQDEVIFEFDLMIKCDGGAIKAFSKCVLEFNQARLPTGKETMAICRNSCLSCMELYCAHVYRPVEATIAINILKGQCNLSRVAASNPGNFKDHIVLYEAADGQIALDEGDSVPLTRRVMAVSLYRKLALFFVGGEDVFEHLVLTLGQSDQVIHGKMGAAELEVKVTWTAVPVRKRPDMFKVVGNQRLLL
ncbi:unnamed protein product [Alopecurus aequalis]